MRLPFLRLRTFIAIALVFAVAGCAAKRIPADATPRHRALYYADQAAIRVIELQSAAIAANEAGSLDDKSAVIIVKFTVAAQKTIKEIPDGYLAALSAGYVAVKEQLSQAVKDRLRVYLAALDAVIALVTKEGVSLAEAG